MRIKGFTLFAIATLFILTGVGCKGGDRAAQEKSKPVRLKYWTVAAQEPALRSIIASYRASHPNVSIDVQVIPEAEYSQRLLEAWADDAGPDIFSIRNNSVYKYKNKIEPMPVSTNLAYRTITGSLKKEEVWVLKQKTLYTPRAFANTFLPQVVADAIIDDKIYGVPLSFDSLVLYTNRDIFNNNNIISAPSTWIPFIQTVKSLTLRDIDNNILQSAVGMGRVDNVLYAEDIVSLIMMQNGANMTDIGTRQVAFDKTVTTPQGSVSSPGQQAALFYADFASPAKEVYTWNESFPDSRKAFMNGQTAMYFGYATDKSIIEQGAPALNFEIAPFPQIDGSPIKKNFTRYWLETVSKRSENIDWAWDFVVFATNSKNSAKYNETTQLPTAHRSLLISQSDKYPELEVFNNQALTSVSWYQGKQPEVAYKLFGEIIQSINDGNRSNVASLIKTIAAKINQTL